MAYPDPFNLATPADTDLRGQGDDRIRELKRALDQRFGTVFTGMDVDPLTFIAGIIPGAAIANGAINLARMAAGSVDTAQLLDASVTGPKIADGVITAAKLVAGTLTPAAGSIGTAELANDAVTTPKILDGAVTESKLADGSVTPAKVAVGGAFAYNLLAPAPDLTDVVVLVPVHSFVAMSVAYTPRQENADGGHGNPDPDGFLDLVYGLSVRPGITLKRVRFYVFRAAGTDGLVTAKVRKHPIPGGAEVDLASLVNDNTIANYGYVDFNAINEVIGAGNFYSLYVQLNMHSLTGNTTRLLYAEVTFDWTNIDQLLRA
jgi:hypothetical protein